MEPPCRYHFYSTMYLLSGWSSRAGTTYTPLCLLPGWSRRVGTTSNPLLTCFLGRAAVPVPLLLHYVPSPWVMPSCRYHFYSTIYLLSGWSRRAGTTSTPLFTFSLGGASVPVPLLLHYVPSSWVEPPCLYYFYSNMCLSLGGRRVGTTSTPLFTFSLG